MFIKFFSFSNFQVCRCSRHLLPKPNPRKKDFVTFRSLTKFLNLALGNRIRVGSFKPLFL